MLYTGNNTVHANTTVPHQSLQVPFIANYTTFYKYVTSLINILRSPTLAAVTPAMTPDVRLATEFMVPVKPATDIDPAGAPSDILGAMLMPPPAVTLIPAAAAAAAILAEVKVFPTWQKE